MAEKTETLESWDRKQARADKIRRAHEAWLADKIMTWTTRGLSSEANGYAGNACSLVGWLCGAAHLTEEQHAALDAALWCRPALDEHDQDDPRHPGHPATCQRECCTLEEENP